MQFCWLVNRSTMGVNSLPKTVTRERRGCDLNPGPSAPESSTLSTRLPSHPIVYSLRAHTSGTISPNFTKFSVEVTCGTLLVSPLAAFQYVMYFRFSG